MSERTEALLSELLEVQRQQLANQALVIEQQRVAQAEHRAAVEGWQRALRIVVAIVIAMGLLVLLPYVWQWVEFFMAL